MKFLDTASKENSLYHHSLYLLGKTTTDTTSYAVTDWVRSANIYYRNAAYLIWRNDSGWQFDDSNYTTLPIATADLVDGQQDYALPSDAFDVQRVEILDGNGDYVLLNRMDKEEVKNRAMSEYYKTDGLPRYYDMVGNSLMLYPAPKEDDVTLTAGIKLYLARDVSAPSNPGAYRDIDQSPGFLVSFHPYISAGCAVDYGVAKNYTQEKMINLRLTLKENEQGILEYYAKRDRDYPTKFRPAVRSSV